MFSIIPGALPRTPKVYGFSFYQESDDINLVIISLDMLVCWSSIPFCWSYFSEQVVFTARNLHFKLNNYSRSIREGLKHEKIKNSNCNRFDNLSIII